MGNSAIGTSDVAAMGRASVAHHTAISRATPAVSHAICGMPAGAGSTSTMIGISRPRNRPMRLTVVGLYELGLSVLGLSWPAFLVVAVMTL